MGIIPILLDKILIGDIVLEHYIVIFDKEEKKIGFIDNFIQITPFIENEKMFYAFKFVQVGILLSGVTILIITNKKKPMGSRIREH